MTDQRTQRAIAAVEAAWPHLATDAFVEQVVLTVLDAIDVEQLRAAAWGEGYAEGRRYVDAERDAWYQRGRQLGRRQATEGWEREWAARWMQDAADPTDGLHPCGSEDAAREMERRGGGYRRAESRLVGPWEPAETEHAIDESSVVNPATGEPYRGSSGPEPYEPPDPLCVCGAPWFGAEGCLTQQPKRPRGVPVAEVADFNVGIGEERPMRRAERRPTRGHLPAEQPEPEPGPHSYAPESETINARCSTCGGALNDHEHATAAEQPEDGTR